MIRTPDGSRWATVDDAARQTRVRAATIRVWATRGKVRRHTVLGRTYVSLDDVADCELDWRRRHETTE